MTPSLPPPLQQQVLQFKGDSGLTLVTTDFQCLRCGACCRHPGEVRLAEGEAEAIAALLGLEVGAFTDIYTTLRPDRRGLRLTERAGGACVFLEGNPPRCAIQAVKPAQCRGFPLSWRYPDAERVCAALAGETRPQTRNDSVEGPLLPTAALNMYCSATCSRERNDT